MTDFEFVFINAKNEIELPDYVEIMGVEYPEDEELQDYEGTAPQYFVKVANEDLQRLEEWLDSQPKELELDIFLVNLVKCSAFRHYTSLYIFVTVTGL